MKKFYNEPVALVMTMTVGDVIQVSALPELSWNEGVDVMYSLPTVPWDEGHIG